jgi:micrococcal nuclease|tara:strand:+ start:27 stop:440 length:414 start_codon:yes stop_codon:yes gene_type:complete
MYTYKAKLDRVIDGDTIDVNMDLGFDISVHKRIRLAGIDTPESRTRDLEEKKRGLASKARLIELLDKGDLVVESTDVGKYGRVLGVLHIYPEDNLPFNINEKLVEEGYAVEYHGGKKKKKEEKVESVNQNEDVPFAD